MRERWLAVHGLMAALLTFPAGGCTSITGLFNEEFIQATVFGTEVASLPGDAPALLVAVDNQTPHLVEAEVSYRGDDDAVKTYAVFVQSGGKIAEALVCPISELTLGDVSDLDQSGARIRLGEGNLTDPFIEVEAFGILLKDQANFQCGDSITFTIVTSSDTLSGYQVFAYIQRSGAP